MSSKLDIDAIINQLINSGGKKVNIKEKDVSLLCKSARDVFMEQPVFLELEAPIKICGRSLLHFYVYRWRAWTIHWSSQTFWIRRVPTRSQLLVLRRLRRSRQTITWDHHTSTRLQSQVQGKLLPPSRKSWVRTNQSHLWILRRVQK